MFIHSTNNPRWPGIKRFSILDQRTRQNKLWGSTLFSRQFSRLAKTAAVSGTRRPPRDFHSSTKWFSAENRKSLGCTENIFRFRPVFHSVFFIFCFLQYPFRSRSIEPRDGRSRPHRANRGPGPGTGPTGGSDFGDGWWICLALSRVFPWFSVSLASLGKAGGRRCGSLPRPRGRFCDKKKPPKAGGFT